jgi:hypothetical protein
MMGTPKTMLCTQSGKDQLVKYHRNDYSVQSKAPCSPCHVMAYNGEMCEKEKRYGLFPRCIEDFDLNEIRSIIDKLYCARF